MNRPKPTTIALIVATLAVAVALQHVDETAQAATTTQVATLDAKPKAPAPDRVAIPPPVLPKAPTTVSTPDGSVRGVVRAVREATLSSRLAARIAEMPLAEGASFKSGTLLVRFDCERQTAEARAAAAAAEAQKKTVDTNVELDKFESIGKNDLAISRSVLDKAKAEADALNTQVKDCNLYAPFAGRVAERMAHNFEAVTVSQPLLRIVDPSALELDVIVPSTWLQWLAEGAEFQFRVDETGQVMTAKVVRVTPAVDPVSKTIRVIGQFRVGKGTDRVLPGMSGTALFVHANG